MIPRRRNAAAGSRVRSGTMVLEPRPDHNPMAMVRAAAWANSHGPARRAPAAVPGPRPRRSCSPRRAAPAASRSARDEPHAARDRRSATTRAPLLGQYRRCSRPSPRRGRREGRPRGGCATIWSRCCSPSSSATSTTAGATRPRQSAPRTLPLDPQTYADADPGAALPRLRSAPMLELPALPRAQQLHVYTSLEQIDLDTLRLLGMFTGARAAARATPALDLVDLFAVVPVARGQRRRQLLARAPAVGARDQARLRRADLRGRRLRLDRAPAATSTRSSCPSSPTTTSSSSARSSTTSSTTTATRSSARRSGGCSTSSSTPRRRCAACGRCSRAAWR